MREGLLQIITPAGAEPPLNLVLTLIQRTGSAVGCTVEVPGPFADPTEAAGRLAPLIEFGRDIPILLGGQAAPVSFGLELSSFGALQGVRICAPNSSRRLTAAEVESLMLMKDTSAPFHPFRDASIAVLETYNLPPDARAAPRPGAPWC